MPRRRTRIRMMQMNQIKNAFKIKIFKVYINIWIVYRNVPDYIQFKIFTKIQFNCLNEFVKAYYTS